MKNSNLPILPRNFEFFRTFRDHFSNISNSYSKYFEQFRNFFRSWKLGISYKNMRKTSTLRMFFIEGFLCQYSFKIITPTKTWMCLWTSVSTNERNFETIRNISNNYSKYSNYGHVILEKTRNFAIKIGKFEFFILFEFVYIYFVETLAVVIIRLSFYYVCRVPSIPQIMEPSK